MKVSKIFSTLGFILVSTQWASAQPRLQPGAPGTDSMGGDPQNNIGSTTTNPTMTNSITSLRKPAADPKNTAPDPEQATDSISPQTGNVSTATGETVDVQHERHNSNAGAATNPDNESFRKDRE